MKTIFKIPASNFDNLNNFEVWQNDNDTYSFSIETIYDFDTKESVEEYLKDILCQFCQWCINNYVDIFEMVDYHALFHANNQFMSIEELYSYFKTLVNGYCNQ